MNILKHPMLPFGLAGLIGLHYALPHPHHGVIGYLMHMGVGLLAIAATILGIRNRLRAERSAGKDMRDK